MNDPILQKKFDEACFKIKKFLNKSQYKEEMDEALHIISEEKIFLHDYDRAYDKVIQIEAVLKEYNKAIPAELSYRKASIFLEHKRNYEEAENIFISLINDENIDESLRDRCRFALCKCYLKEISLYSEDGIDELTAETIDKIKTQLDYLQERAYSRKLDEYVVRNLWELKKIVDNIEKNNEFVIINFPGGKESKYLNRDEALKNNQANIFIDFTSKDLFINGHIEHFSNEDIKLVYLLAKGTTTEEAQITLDIERDIFFQRVKRLRHKLEKFEIKTINRKYKLEPSINIKVLYKIDDEIYYSLISQDNLP